ncbi:phosphoribosylglycinamide formyltransferase [Phycisphaeraceae bacterium D3-23]
MPTRPELSPLPTRRPLRVAALVSGGGTTVKNLAEVIAAGGLDAEIVAVVCSNDKAREQVSQKVPGIPTHLVSRKDHTHDGEFDIAAFSQRIFDDLRAADTDLVVLAGFLSKLRIPDDFAGRVLNIHPALLPAYGGQGMHGRHVHAAVIAAGESRSGCTVHYADQSYDTGPIILQKSCDVLPDDTPETLAARVFEQEKRAYPEAIRRLMQAPPPSSR